MSALNLLKASLFSTAQTAWLIVFGVIIFLLLAGNVLLWLYIRKVSKRRLCTKQLQQRREELLKRLSDLNANEAGKASEEEEAEDAADEEEDSEEEKQPAGGDGSAAVKEGEDGEEELTTEILPVTAMSKEMRRRFGLLEEENESKKFIVRYSYSFEARLRNAEPEVQARYVEFANEVLLYKGVEIKNSYKQQRIYKGKKTLGLILFRGKVLCVAFALDPNEYMATKYRGLDKSNKKRFEKTPMLYKISSTRRLEYAKYLLLQVADKNTIVLSEEPQKGEYNLQPIGRDDMYASGLMRINIVRELLDEADAEGADIAEQEIVESAVAEAPAEVEEPAVEEAPAEVEEPAAEEAPAEADAQNEEAPEEPAEDSKE